MLSSTSPSIAPTRSFPILGLNLGHRSDAPNTKSIEFLNICLIILLGYGIMSLWEDDSMAVNYNKLWKLLIDRNMNRTQLRCAAHISTNAIAKLGKNEPVSVETLEKICQVLQCDIGDIMEIKCAAPAVRERCVP